MDSGNIVIMTSKFGDFAQRENGQDLFKVVDPKTSKIKIGFSIVIKDSPYDELPVMPFKK